MQLHLRKFDPSAIADDKVLVFLGKRNTGKSFLVRDIMFYHRDIPIGTIISPTEKVSPFYNTIVPSLFIHDEYKPELLNNVVLRQKMIKKKKVREQHGGGRSSLDPRGFLILDDCLYDNCWKHDKNIRYLFMNGRHVNMLVAITMQSPLGVPPDLRTNIDYVFILRENNYNNRKRIYENYSSIFPTFEMFCTALDTLTDGYGCLVIDNTSKSNKLEDNIFWYQADDHPPFTIGSKEFWEIHNENIGNEDEEEQEEMFDIDKFRKKKSSRSPVVNFKRIH